MGMSVIPGEADVASPSCGVHSLSVRTKGTVVNSINRAWIALVVTPSYMQSIDASL